MNVVDAALQTDDPELVDLLTRLGDIGVLVEHDVEGRRMALLDRAGAVLIACAVRLDPVAQLREIAGFYVAQVLRPWATRH